MKKETHTLDEIFFSLSNKYRRDIIKTLSFGPSSISQLAKQNKLSLPAIHKHIKILESAGFINRKKSGKTNFLSIKRGSIIKSQDWLKQYNAHWGSDKETLENYVKKLEEND